MMEICKKIADLRLQFEVCEPTPNGARIATHCLYPSFEQVSVFVRKTGDRYIVTDGGQAVSVAWTHGKDGRAVFNGLKKAALHYGCEVQSQEILAEAAGDDWLLQAIMAVANASSQAAHAALEKSNFTNEQRLVNRIDRVVQRSKIGFETRVGYDVVGNSGKTHRFDLLLFAENQQILVDVVVPHHNSVAAKYLALSDTSAGKNLFKFAVFEKELTREDKALISGVADLLPYKAIVETDGKAFLVH